MFLLSLNNPFYKHPLWAKLIYIVLVVLFMYITGSLVAVGCTMGISDHVQKMRIMQLFISVFAFPGSALILARLFREPDSSVFSYLSQYKSTNALSFLLAIMAMLAVVPFINWLADINSQIIPPGAYAEELEKLTEQLLTTSSWTIFLLNLFVMALVPALGEEMLFRGVIQNTLVRHLNPHVAIAMSGLIFSLFHFELDGLFPRWILGMALGYMLYWSKSLWLSSTAHFVNNGIIVAYAFFCPDGINGLKIDEIGVDNIVLALFSFIAFIAFMYVLLRFTAQRVKQD